MLYSEEPASSDQDDHRAWYSDGAYVARPILGPQLPSSFRKIKHPEPERHRRNTSSELSGEEDHIDADDSAPDPISRATRSAQSAYHQRLLSIFNTQVEDLQQPVPADLAHEHNLSDDAWTNAAHLSHSKIFGMLRDTIPTPVQLAHMHPDHLLFVIEIFSHRFLKSGKPISSCASVWIWSLLARLAGFVGSLGTEDVSVVRELAKHAVRCAKGEGVALGDDSGDLGDDRDDNLDNDEKNILSSKHGGAEGDTSEHVETTDCALKTRAVLDMIVTVVGEIFGQRDLLDSRELW